MTIISRAVTTRAQESSCASLTEPESSQRLKTMASAKGSKGMRQTALLAPEEAPVGDGDKNQAAGMDDHLAKPVTPERRRRWCSGGAGATDARIGWQTNAMR